MTTCSLSELSNDELLARVRLLADRERHTTAQLVASLGELDARRLYLAEGCASLFSYCVQTLHLSEHAAYGRMEAARAARRFPRILERLESGALTLTSVCLIARHLTEENCCAVLDAASHKSKREVEHLVAELRPLPDVPSAVRKMPAPPKFGSPLKAHVLDAEPAKPATLPSVVGAPTARPTMVVPLAPECYKVQFTVSRETYEKLRRVQDLLRHTVPTGDVAVIFDRALSRLLDDLARTKLAASSRSRQKRAPAPGSRHIPAAVKREVWARDDGRCAFVGNGGRCTETEFLEFHYTVPFADGGEASAANIQLRCRAHNAHEAWKQSGGFLVREVPPPWRVANSVRTELPGLLAGSC
jgi:5-methylcytosine-specific restriction endonuclease McrA